jgi:hypothetical protein
MNGAANRPIGYGSWLLRAAWVYGYAFVIMVFEFLRRIERRSKAKSVGPSVQRKVI